MRSRPAERGATLTAITDDALLGGRLKLLQPARGHRAGHDAILLAAAAPTARLAVDLGAGVGTAGLALLARGVARRVTFVEIDGELAALARTNCMRNGFVDQASVIAADIRTLGRRGGPPLPKAASADLAIANPPFNDPALRQSSPHGARRRAHSAPESELAAWTAAAERVLRPGGALVLIHRPEALPAMLAAFAGRFGAIELVPIHPRPSRPAIRLIVRARKGRRTALSMLHGLVLADEAGRPTQAAEAVLRHAEPLGAA